MKQQPSDNNFPIGLHCQIREVFPAAYIYGPWLEIANFLRINVSGKNPHLYSAALLILFSPVLFSAMEAITNALRTIRSIILNKTSVMLLLMFLTFRLNASHLVGGNFSLRHVSGTQYELTLRVFRDCENGIADFNKNLVAGMYDKADDRQVSRIYMGNIISNQPLVFVGDNCINIPTGCTSIGTYKAQISLDPQVYNSKAGYYFSWERCCRNTIIQNIVVGNQPGATGEVYYMEIPPVNIINSTPVFNRNPLTLLCVNNPFSFNYDVTDADGDSLVYSLVTPLKGFTDSKSPNDDGQQDYPLLYAGNAARYPYRYPEVQWQNGYSLYGNIMDGNPKLLIDINTGQLNVTPTRQGVYAIAIRVEEYRKGTKLGEVRLDLQLTVSSCNTNQAPVYNSAALNKTYIVNATDTLNFPVIITDPNRDSLNFKYSGTVFGENAKIKEPFATLKDGRAKAKFETEFNWITNCGHITGDTQTVDLWVEDNGCPIYKKTLSKIKIIVVPPPTPAPPAMACLDRLDENTLRINFGDFTTDKYFAYYLFIRKNPDSTETVIDTIRRNDTRQFITDEKAFEHAVNHYRYYFTGVNICGFRGQRSYYINSDPSIPFEPAQPYITRVTVKENNAVLMEWEEAPEEDFKSYNIYRRINFSKDSFKLYKSIYTRSQKYFIDSNVNVQVNSYCYRMTVTNQCGYTSMPGENSCTILLKGAAKPFENELKWNPYINWRNAVDDYTVVRHDDRNTDTLVARLPGLSVSFTDDKLNINWGAYWYKIIAKEALTGVISESNEIYLVQEPVVYAPNAFTPDGDGINDVWGVMPVFVKDFNLKVFNRWGQVVFEASDKYRQWNGIYKDNDPFNNVYIWQIDYTGWDQSKHWIHGNVTTYK